jgi:serine/threonine protein kinase
MSIPKERLFDSQQVELLRILGRVDIIMKSQASSYKDEISVRIFEARLLDGIKCFLKEFSPSGVNLGKKEMSITRKLLTKWKNMTSDSISMASPYFPVILGHLYTDERIESYEFRKKWQQRFPMTKPPESGNLWLIFQWDDSTFKSLRRYPSLPQVVEGLDYFNKNNRVQKRWRFIRKIFKKSLESLDYLNRAGYCHNAISSESLWLSTTNQQNVNELTVSLAELGSCEKLSDLGPYAKTIAMRDLYNLGFVFLELVISSFSEDNIGAQKTRAIIGL